MTEPTIRRLAGEEILARLDELAEVLLDCVEGGASVSFMWPLPRERALAFWRGVGESVAGDERLLLVAEAEGGSSVPCNCSSTNRRTSRTAPTWRRCWCTGVRVGAASARR